MNQGTRPATAVFPSDPESRSSKIADLGDLLCGMPRLDTNVLLSGIPYPASIPGEIMAAWRHGSVEVILDEVHRAPGLFPRLRGLIDRNRRAGRKSGQYLLLESASLDLLKQTGESLAGRINCLELTPFNLNEPGDQGADKLWLRGGFPKSLLAPGEARSLRWRQDFIRTCLEREIPQFGPRLAAETLRRFWVMLAHHQGGILNAGWCNIRSVNS